jgi:succinoglycan biosynthesis protein ExoV
LAVVPERPLIVFGSGAGYYQLPSPDGIEVLFVRGPKTAQLIRRSWNMSVDWITDPGVLVADFKKKLENDIPISFVPHWTTLEDDPKLGERLNQIGVKLIDPTLPVESVLELIERSRLVVSEALHGAVVADAFRIPWIPVYGQHGHLFKWIDWCDSIGLQYDPQFFETSSMDEIVKRVPSMLSSETRHRENLWRVHEKLIRLRERIQ